jgi:quercetin dioxygenase-like cupin family protein
MSAPRRFDAAAATYTEPVDAYPPEVLPMIPEAELTGTRVKIHHRGTEGEPQLLEVQVDPNLELASHAHKATEIIAVIEGELRYGSQVCKVGDSLLVPGGTLYALRAGPEGVRFFNFRGAADYTYTDRAGFRDARARWFGEAEASP